MEEPSIKPSCCGKEAKWVEITPRISCFYCESCKKEVLEKSPYVQAAEAYCEQTLEDWKKAVDFQLLPAGYAQDAVMDNLDPFGLGPDMEAEDATADLTLKCPLLERYQ